MAGKKQDRLSLTSMRHEINYITSKFWSCLYNWVNSRNLHRIDAMYNFKYYSLSWSPDMGYTIIAFTAIIGCGKIRVEKFDAGVASANFPVCSATHSLAC